MASTDAKTIPIKNAAYRITFPIYDADGDLVTGATGLDSEVSKDAGTFADCTNEATEIATSSGMYYLDLTSTEMNADTVAVIVKTSSVGAKTTPIVMYTSARTINDLAYPATSGRSMVVDASGLVDANTVKVGPTGSGTAQTARDIGLSVLLSSGTGTGQLKLASGYVAMTWADIAAPTTSVNLSGTTIATTQKVDVETIKTNPVVNAGTVTFPTTATLASTTNITAGTVTTATNVTTINDGALIVNRGTATASAATTLTLAASASAVTSELRGHTLTILTGTGAGQSRLITSYTSGRVATVSPGWTTTPDSNCTYAVGISNHVDVRMVQNSGTAATNLGAMFDGTGYAGGTIKLDVNMVNIAGSAVSTSTAQIGVNVVNAAGTAWNSGAITANTLAADTITAAKVASDVGTEIATAVWASGTRTLTAGTNVDGSTFTAIPWNAAWDAEVQSEVDDALIAKGLDHLVFTSVTGTDIADNSIIAKMVSKSATADWDTFTNTTDALEALRDRGDAAWITATGFSTLDAAGVRAAVGLASANLDTQLSTIDTVVDSILVDTAEIGAAGAGLSAIPWNAAWDAEVQSECNDALVAYDAATGTDISGLNDLSATEVENAVWDAVLADHQDAGSTGEALGAAGSAGDPWTTSLPGAYSSGTAGYIIGNNLDEQVSAIPTANENADALLKRDWTGLTGEAARSVLNALRFVRNKWSVSGTTLTVTKEDDTTSAWTAEVATTPGAEPITGSDPT